MQRLHEGISQSLQEREWAAQEEHVPLNFPPLSQTGNRLVYHRLINAGSNIFPFCSLIQQRLNVGLCENAAACSDGVGAVSLQCHLVEFIHSDVQQGCHLVDKSPRTASTRTVHTLFHAAGEEDNFCIFSAQFNDGICFGIAFFYGEKSSMHFLYKGDFCSSCKSQTGRTSHMHREHRCRMFLDNGLQLFRNGFLDFGKVPLIGTVQDMMVCI